MLLLNQIDVGRSRALFGIFALALLSLSCTDQQSNGPADIGRASGLRFAPRYTVHGASQAVADIVNIRLTARSATTNAVVATRTISVSPTDAEWNVGLEVPADAGTVVVLIELLNAASAVEWSGVTPPITVEAGTSTAPQPVELFQGPPANLLVLAMTVAPDAVTVPEGLTTQLNASVQPPGVPATVIWSSLDPAVATVNSSGLVTTLRDGNARIVAEAGPRADTAVVTVTQRPAAIVFTPDTTRVGSLGTEFTVGARVVDPRGATIEGAAVNWSVGNPAVIEHLGGGRFRSLANGTSQVTATSIATPSAVGTGVVIVAQRAGAVAITPDTARLAAVGATQAFTATLTDANGRAMSGAVAWRSSNSAVATIDDAGLARAVGSGSTQIMAVANAGAPDSAVGRAVLLVAQTIATIQVTPAAATLTAIGDTTRISATAKDANGNTVPNVTFEWQSPASTIATVDGGLVTATGPGTTQIIAIFGAVRAAASITVHPSVARVTITPPNGTFTTFGQTMALTASAFDRNNHGIAGRVASWSSSNAAVVSVNAEGVATAHSNGSAIITATVDAISATGEFTVNQTVAPVPNLVVPRILIVPTDTIRQGDSVFVNVIVKNIGNAAAPASLTGLAVLDAATFEPVFDNDTLLVTPALNAGDSVVLNLRARADDLEGWPDSVRIGAAADVPEAVTESDETDNRHASMVRYVRFGVAYIVFSESFLQFHSIGDTITVTGTPHDINDRPMDVPVTWSTANSAVADVDANGNVVARGAGSTILYATAGQQTDSTFVLVLQVAVRLELTPDTASLNALNDTVQFTARIYDARDNLIARPAQMFSRNPSVAFLVDTLGHVVSQNVGTARIVAHTFTCEACPAVRDSALLTVRQIAATLDIPTDSMGVFRFDSVMVPVLAQDSNGVELQTGITYVSRRPDVATVTPAGFIHAGEVTDTVRIIASAGELSDSVLVRVISPIAPGVTRVWVGNTASWHIPSNWLPAGVPTINDTVGVRASAPNMPRITSTTEVGGIALEPDASIDIQANSLTIYGKFLGGSIIGTGTVFLAAPEPRFAIGNLPNVDVTGFVVAGSALNIAGSLTVNSGTLNVGAGTVTVLGAMSRNGGQIIMQGAPGRLSINGSVYWNGGNSVGMLTAGTLEVGGNFFVDGSTAEAFAPSLAHKVLLNGSARQDINFQLPGETSARQHFRHLQVDNAAGVHFMNRAFVTGDVTLMNGNVTSSINQVYLGGNLFDETGTRWRAINTTVFGETPQLPATLQTNLSFDWSTARTTYIQNDFTVTGNLLVANAHTLQMNGRVVAVNGDMTVSNGNFRMTNPADRMIVSGTVNFNDGSTVGDLTDGVLTIGGHFLAGGTSPEAFSPSDNHKVVLNGSAVQTINFQHPGAEANHQHFNYLDISNTGNLAGFGVRFLNPAFINGSLDLMVGAMTLDAVVSVGANVRLRNGTVVNNFSNLRWGGSLTDER